MRLAGGNVTGVSWIATALVPKRLQLLRQMAGNPAMMGALVNPGYPEYDLQLRELEEASAALGQKINILRVATAHDVDTAFTALVQQRAGALIVANDPFFLSLRDQIVALDRNRITRSCALSFVVAFAIGYSRRQLLANTVIAASRVVLTIRIAGTVLN
jgi:ABC-type uncharacterized transport system substrate-binding protein